MGWSDSRRSHYLAALLLPVAGVGLTWFLSALVSVANIALIFIVIVILTAIYTSTGPAMVSALASFLAFNFFFTEPRGSLMVLHRQDMLTLSLFLVAAVGVGQLAARLREQFAYQSSLAATRLQLLADLEAEKSARDHEVMRSSLLSSVSHDFRTPLTAMVGAASTLLELGDQLGKEEKTELLQSILSEARRLNSYTQKLLDLTRLGKGELTLHRTTLAIDEILNVVLKRIHQQFPDQAITLNLAADLPPLQAHAALLEQALYNVLENACKFTRPGTTIDVSAKLQDDRLQLDIADSGPGIPDSDKERVFEMFHSADRGDRHVAGSGLGLAINKGMVGAHGGSISIHDNPAGTGCLVRIRLPAATGTAA